MSCRTAFVLPLLLLAAPPVWGQPWAGKMFEETHHDFGSVARGAKAEYEFVLSNIYLEDVHIASVRSSCGCTSPRIKKPLLKTYEKGAIIAGLNTRSFSGQRSATITVTIDKPYHAEVQLHVSAHIRRDVVFDPGSVQLGNVDRGEAVHRKVAVTYAGRNNWRILEVRSANPHITAELVEKGRGGGRVRYELTVHLDRDAPVGYLSDHVILITNDRRSKQVPIQVEGRVLSAVTVSPASLFMGVLQPGKKVTKQLVVKGREPFRILSITCDDESFEFGGAAHEVPKPVHLVPVTFVAGEHSGKVSEMIRIETDLGELGPELAAYAVVVSP